ncbi:hypothetical protein QOZ80_7BG0585050 [Eleusine coracana subsp. coracana]|nr:hypothetical protein QOZ80_7BG0585050 [Eleusine coracana subsp. coracana]
MAAPPELIDDATAEIFLRLPPDDPACLVRAALVCKRWRRILSDPAFPRRYREFHRTPPLLGFLRNRSDRDPSPQFVSTADASPFSSPEFDCKQWWTLDSRHGRVLFRCVEPDGLVVWDPITGDKHYIIPQLGNEKIDLAAAVLCAADGCNHLDCHSGPFLVVFVSADFHGLVTWASVYSSETGAWSHTDAYLDFPCCMDPVPCLLAGDALYFMAFFGMCLVKYDLALQDLSIIDMPKEHDCLMTTAMISEGGGLGLASIDGYSLLLWSRQAVTDGSEDWVHHRVIDLKTVLPIRGLRTIAHLAGVTEGANTIFVNTYVGIFAIELSSGQVRKVGEREHYTIVPYMSFYTPDFARAILPQS